MSISKFSPFDPLVSDKTVRCTETMGEKLAPVFTPTMSISNFSPFDPLVSDRTVRCTETKGEKLAPVFIPAPTDDVIHAELSHELPFSGSHLGFDIEPLAFEEAFKIEMLETAAIVLPSLDPTQDHRILFDSYYEQLSMVVGHTSEQLAWVRSYLAMQSPSKRRLGFSLFRFEERFEDFFDAALALNLPKLATAFYSDYRNLPFSPRSYAELPSVPHDRSSPEYWSFCVINQWPRLCKGCSSSSVFPRTSADNGSNVCTFCRSDCLRTLLAGFGAKLPMVTPESFSDIADMLRSILSTIADSCKRSAGYLGEGLRSVFSAMCAPLLEKIDQFLASVTGMAGRAARKAVMGIILIVLLIDFLRAGLQITTRVIMIFLELAAYAGCSLISGMLSLWQKVTHTGAHRTKPGRLYVHPESDEPLPVQVAACLLVALGPMTSGLNVASFLKALMSARSLCSAASLGHDTMEGLCGKLPSAIQTYTASLFGFHASADNEEERSLLVEANGLLSELKKSPGLTGIREVAESVIRLHEDINGLICSRLQSSRKTQPLFASLARSLSAYLAVAQSTIGEDSQRPEPVCLYMESKPGVGKTYAAAALAVMLSPRTPAAMRLYTHSRTAYQTGYKTGHFMYHIDELGCVSTEEEKSIYSTLLKWISVAQEEMPMAAVEDKGTKFSSPFILITTNHPITGGNTGLTYPDAFFRRVVHVKATLRPGWQNAQGVLSMDVINSQIDAGNITAEDTVYAPWMQFQLSTVVTRNGKAVHEPLEVKGFGDQLDLSQLASFVKAKVQINHDAYEARKNSLTRLAQHQIVDDLAELQEEGLLPVDEGKLAVLVAERKHDMDDHEEVDLPGGDELQDEYNAFLEGLMQGDPEEDGPVVSPEMDFGLAEGVEEKLERAPIVEASGVPRSWVPNAVKAFRSPTARKVNSRAKRYEDRAAKRRSARVILGAADIVLLSDKFDERYRLTNSQDKEACSVYNASYLATELGKYLKCAFAGAGMMAAVRATCRRSYLSCVTRMWSCEPTCPDQITVLKILVGVGISSVMCLAIFRLLESRGRAPIAAENAFRPRRTPTMRRGLQNGPGAACRPVHVTAESAAQMLLENVPGLQPSVARVISENYGRIFTPGGNNAGWFAHSSKWCCPAHTFRALTGTGFFSEGTSFEIECAGVIRQINFSSENLRVMLSSDGTDSYVDWVSYDTKLSFPRKKDLTKFFLEAEAHEDLWHKEAFLVSASDAFEVGSAVKREGVLDPYAEAGTSAVLLSLRWEYAPVTGVGDCGRLLVVPHFGAGPCIIGSHVAKLNYQDRKSASVVLTKTWLRHLTDHQDVDSLPSFQLPHVELIPLSGPSAAVPDGRLGEGLVQPHLRRNPNVSTKYIESAIARTASILPTTNSFAPAVLGDPKDLRCGGLSQTSLLRNRKQKYDMAGAFPFQPRHTKLAARASLDILPQGGPHRALTWEECLNGCPGLNALPRSSSIGWPAKLSVKQKGKRDAVIFDEIGQTWSFEPLFLEKLQEADEAVRSGRELDCIMQIIPKDEILPVSKNEKRDVRTVTIPPAEVNLLLKKYFGGYCAAVTLGSHVGDTPFLIGVDFYSSSWDLMIKRLLKIGAVGFDGDHGGFEFNHDSDVLAAWVVHTDGYYASAGLDTPSDKAARRALMPLFIHTRQLNGNVVFSASGEFPSGLSPTANFNAFAAWYYLAVGYFAALEAGGRVALLKHASYGASDNIVVVDGHYKTRNMDTDDFDLNALTQNLGISTDGDDHVVSVAPESASFFSGALFAKFMVSHNRKYTPADKESVFSADRPIHTLGYLSGHTHVPRVSPLPGVQFFYVLDAQKARRQLAWVSKEAGERGLADNIDSFLSSQWALGERQFHHNRQELIAACQLVGYEIKPLEYAKEYARRTSVSPESLVSLLKDAHAQRSRGAVTIGDSYDAQRFLTAMSLNILGARSEFEILPMDKLRRAHGIAEQDRVCMRSRALKLLQVGHSTDWFEKAGLTSNGAHAFVECDGLYYAADGNNRLAAAQLAAHWLDLPPDIPLLVPVVSCASVHGRVIARAAPFGGCKFCSYDRCGCLEPFKSSMVSPEMDSGPSLSAAEDGPAIQPTAGTDSVPESLMVMQQPDVVNMCKREGCCALVIAPTSHFSCSWPALAALTGLLGKADIVSFIKPHPQAWWFPMYALYSGSIRLTTILATNHAVFGSADPLTASDLVQVQEGTHAGLLPTEYTNPEVGFTSTQLPMLTTLGAVVIPHTYADVYKEDCMSGCFGFTTEESTVTGRFFTSVGDDAVMSLLWSVPDLMTSRPTSRPLVKVPRPSRSQRAAASVVWRVTQGSGQFQQNPLRRSVVHSEMDAGKGMVFEDSTVAMQPVHVRNPAGICPSIEEKAFSYPDMMHRVQKVDTLTWTLGDPQDQTVYSATAPWDFFIGSAQEASAKFKYFSGGMRFRFNIQSSPMQSGTLMVTVVPLQGSTAVLTRHASSLPSRSVCNHCFLRAGATSVVELEVPYVHARTMLDTVRGDQVPQFTLLITVLNPLMVGTGASKTVQISMFSCFKDCSLAIVKPAVAVPEGAGLSTFSSNVADVVKKTVDVVGSVGALVGQVQDRPNVGLNPANVVRRAFPYMANSTNVDYRQVLGLLPGTTGSMSPAFMGTTANETKLDYLTSIWTLYEIVTFNAASDTGSVIVAGEISPIQLAHLAVQGAKVQESLLGYCSLFHSYWTGPIEVRFDFVATQYHTFRVVFCTHYGGKSVAGSVRDATQQNMVCYDYSYQKPSFSVIMPWRVPKSVLRVPGGFGAVVGVHTAGQWSLRVDTPLVAPDQVTDTIRVNIAIRGGTGFALHGAYEGSLQYEPIPYEEKAP
jgi:hypothetical protein